MCIVDERHKCGEFDKERLLKINPPSLFLLMLDFDIKEFCKMLSSEDTTKLIVCSHTNHETILCYFIQQIFYYLFLNTRNHYKIIHT